MITKLTASNFRSLSTGTEIHLSPLTALVGRNGTGKSNTVDALRLLSDCMRINLEGAITSRNGIAAVRRWATGGRPFNVTLGVEVKTESFTGSYYFTIVGDRKEEYRVKSERASIFSNETTDRHKLTVLDGVIVEGEADVKPKVNQLNLVLPVVAGDVRFSGLAEAMKSMRVYSIFPDTLSNPQTYDAVKPMQDHGRNWLSILRDQEEGTWKPELLAALHALTDGDLVDLKLDRVGGFLAARFRHDTKGRVKKWFDASQESDGTLRVAGILTALLQEPHLPLVGIEEPELTVHPGAIPLVMDYIRQATERSQVVITTHSPDLLDQVRTEEVRVVDRRDGITTIGPMAEEQRRAVSNGLLTLGETLRTEGIQQETLEFS